MSEQPAAYAVIPAKRPHLRTVPLPPQGRPPLAVLEALLADARQQEQRWATRRQELERMLVKAGKEERE